MWTCLASSSHIGRYSAGIIHEKPCFFCLFPLVSGLQVPKLFFFDLLNKRCKFEGSTFFFNVTDSRSVPLMSMALSIWQWRTRRDHGISRRPNRRNLMSYVKWLRNPQDQCMVYLPTFRLVDFYDKRNIPDIHTMGKWNRIQKMAWTFVLGNCVLYLKGILRWWRDTVSDLQPMAKFVFTHNHLRHTHFG